MTYYENRYEDYYDIGEYFTRRTNKKRHIFVIQEKSQGLPEHYYLTS